MLDLTAIILTYNEEKNIVSCINSIKEIAKRIVVIDSFSTDATVQLALNMGAEVYQHKFVNHAKQYIYGEKIADVETAWVMRLDADERLTEEARDELEQLCIENRNTDVNGIILRFKVVFMGKELKHGGVYPFRKLLVYKNGKGYMEERNMDEHIVLKEGKSIEMRTDCLHCDYKDLNSWIDKHNKYSSREVMDYYESLHKEKQVINLNRSAKLKRIVKFGVYYKLPMGVRAHLYYVYRYYFKLGFLDGREGKIFAFMQAYWYRYLVDAKIYEKKVCNNKED